MPMFGSQFGAQQQAAPQLMPMPQAPAPAMRKRGLFGGMADYLGGESGTPGINRLATIGATLKDIGGAINGGNSDNLAMMQQVALKRAQDAQMQAYQQIQQERETAKYQAEQAQAAQRQQYISGLPQEDQPLAALGTDAYVKSVIDQRKPKDPKYFNTGQAVVGIGPDGQANVLYRDPVRPNDGPSQYEVMTPEQVKVAGLTPGSYKRNTRTNDVIPIGRQKAQYTEFAGKAAQFADRTNASDQTLRAFEESSVSPEGVFVAQSGLGSETERQVRQAQREFVNAILRQESGAAIGKDEFASAAQQYFPQPGDSIAVIQQKQQARERTIRGLMNASQGAYEEWYDNPERQPETPKGRGALDARGGSRSGAKVRVWNPATGRLE